MDGLEKALGDIARLTDRWMRTTSLAAQGLALETGSAPAPVETPTRLVEVPEFGDNPGALRLFQYRPVRLAPEPALVVVLHGCTQTAAAYDLGSGWSELADRHGFVLVYPEQQSGNNPKTCFNWFNRRDTAAGRGEAGSIRAMIDWAMNTHGIAPGRVFITGLSAGAAMSVVMLALYPELFAAGAVIAGMPFRAATTVHGALTAMFEGRSHSAAAWGDLVREATDHSGPWPRLSIWQGDADPVVVPSNAGELLKQWLDIHGLDPNSGHADVVDGYPHRVWRGSDGTPEIETWTIAGMGHGTPIDTRLPGGGVAGPFMLDVGISSTAHIAAFFGLTGVRMLRPAPGTRPEGGEGVPAEAVPAPVIRLPAPGDLVPAIAARQIAAPTAAVSVPVTVVAGPVPAVPEEVASQADAPDATRPGPAPAGALSGDWVVPEPDLPIMAVEPMGGRMARLAAGIGARAKAAGQWMRATFEKFGRP